MKRVILSILVVGSLLATSCKKGKGAAAGAVDTVTSKANEAANATKEAAGDVAKATGDVAASGVDAAKTATDESAGAVGNIAAKGVDAVSAAIAGITIPDFGNPQVNEYAKSFLDYAKSYVANKGDVMKDGLAKKATDLAAKAESIKGKLDGEGSKKLADFMSKVQGLMTSVTAK